MTLHGFREQGKWVRPGTYLTFERRSPEVLSNSPLLFDSIHRAAANHPSIKCNQYPESRMHTNVIIQKNMVDIIAIGLYLYIIDLFPLLLLFD